eukprot:TRINITY_DN11614_c0_g2_i1.p1 TRINITY_DN11614_c0_g2~~TRINITY_DN11614_c0_g2_i1.p1  ORF type:complete len:133 (+),score=1.15 TRINITY_DN11614_c0_g2_i1:131-529(+)
MMICSPLKRYLLDTDKRSPIQPAAAQGCAKYSNQQRQRYAASEDKGRLSRIKCLEPICCLVHALIVAQLAPASLRHVQTKASDVHDVSCSTVAAKHVTELFHVRNDPLHKSSLPQSSARRKRVGTAPACRST